MARCATPIVLTGAAAESADEALSAGAVDCVAPGTESLGPSVYSRGSGAPPRRREPSPGDHPPPGTPAGAWPGHRPGSRHHRARRPRTGRRRARPGALGAAARDSDPDPRSRWSAYAAHLHRRVDRRTPGARRDPGCPAAGPAGARARRAAHGRGLRRRSGPVARWCGDPAGVGRAQRRPTAPRARGARTERRQPRRGARSARAHRRTAPGTVPRARDRHVVRLGRRRCAAIAR